MILRGWGVSDGLTDWQTDGQTDICNCRVAFVTDKGGLNSTTIQNCDSVNRKPQFLDFLANFQSQIRDTIFLSEKNPFAQQFVFIKSFVWSQW